VIDKDGGTMGKCETRKYLKARELKNIESIKEY